MPGLCVPLPVHSIPCTYAAMTSINLHVHQRLMPTAYEQHMPWPFSPPLVAKFSTNEALPLMRTSVLVAYMAPPASRQSNRTVFLVTQDSTALMA